MSDEIIAPHAIVTRTGPMFTPGLSTLKMRNRTAGVLKAMAMVVEAEAKRATPVGVSGTTRSSIKTVMMDELEIRVVNDSPAAAFVETGTKPHFPPKEALYLWVKRVLGIQNEFDQVSEGGRKLIGQGRGRAMKVGKELGKRQLAAVETRGTASGKRVVVYGYKTIAFLIARHISKVGTAGRAQNAQQFGLSPGVAGYWPFAAGVDAAEKRRSEFQEFLSRGLAQDLGGG